MGICSCSSARGRNEERNAKTKAVEVKSSYKPASTRVAVLPVMNAAAEKKYVKGEINQSLVTTRNLIEKAFADRGFIVKKVSTDAPRLDSSANNGHELAKQFHADLVVDCSIKELYTFVSGSFVQRLAGVAVINMKIYSSKEGYLISDDFLDRRDGPPGIIGWATKNSQMREKALRAVVQMALDGLLKSYAVSANGTPTTRDIAQNESEPDAAVQCASKEPVQSAIQVETKPEPPTVVKVVEPISPSTSPQPQVTKGPKYLMVNGYSLVPLKSIAEWLGATINFDRDSDIITLKTGSSIVSIKLNADVASVNGKLVQLQTSAIERNGTTYVPLRFLGEAFAAKVKFDAVTGEISIENPSRSAVLVLSK
ncbi:MAG: copper amine oxidase N-terminal domain-containing protein [Armatimonadota bacterium]